MASCRMITAVFCKSCYILAIFIIFNMLIMARELHFSSIFSRNTARAFGLFSTASTPSPEIFHAKTVDDHFMRLALRHAQLAYRQKEVPIGAVVVDTETGKVLSTARNSVEKQMDGTGHAEMIAIQKAMQVVGNWRLSNCTLYTTLEPCPMCMGAIQSCRVGKVVYGAKDHRLGACGSWIDLVNEKQHPFHTVEVQGGVCEVECGDILKRFFRWRRSEAKSSGDRGGPDASRVPEK